MVDPAPDVLHQCRVEAAFPNHPVAPRLSEAGLQGDEGEAAAKREVDERERAIGDVHGSDDVEVLRHVDRPPFAILVRIAELDRIAGRSLVGLQERQQLAEDLGGTATVDLLDDHHVPRGRIRRCVPDGLHEYAVRQGQLPVTHRAPASDEVFVGEVRMELDGTDLAPCARPSRR